MSNLTSVLEKPEPTPTKPPSIYFNAHLSSYHKSSGVVPFNQLKDSSSVNGFDVKSGKFNCPVDGLYFFYFHYMSVSDGHIAPAIYVDGTRKCYAYAQERKRSHSCAIVIKLTKGQSVYIDNSNSYGIRWGEYSGFVGYLISQ